MPPEERRGCTEYRGEVVRAPGPFGPEQRGEIDGRGCLVPPNPKRWTIQVGYRLPSLEELGTVAERLHEDDEMEATLESVAGTAQIASTQPELQACKHR